MARRRLPRFVFDYVEGGAEDESALARNAAALARLRLRPRVLRDVSCRSQAVRLLGQELPSPLLVAPTGLNGLVRRDGDVALARAAAAHGLPFVLSSAATTRLEEVAERAGGDLWFQLYVLSARHFAESLMARARAAGYRVLVLTVDVPVSGARERDQRNGFRMPFRLTPSLALDACRRPAWCLDFLRGGMPELANLKSEGAGDLEAQAALLARQMDTSLAWESLAWVRDHWPGRVLLKGVLDPEDADRAMAAGLDGVIVSNHGGRQLDAAPATIEALPGVVAAVAGRGAVLVDSGFRRGADVLKAVALGADAVLLGRATLYGLAAAGEAGAAAVIALLKAEIDRNLALLGCASLGELGPDRVSGDPPAGASGPGAPSPATTGELRG
ncbi:MAG: alpha-hydroxy-acid oxidizing protein [Rhodocyclaceae bacterium]|nr:alpha-hydroxy-acid oxidizing protein [Rhodocyclaceae bacterium]